MPIVSIRIPQLGEGLEEALLVATLKTPGEQVCRDEPLYTMETDKAVTDVESPYDGKLIDWLVELNTVHPIGTVIANLEVSEAVQECPTDHGRLLKATRFDGSQQGELPDDSKDLARPNRVIPPRTRSYLKKHGLLAQAHLIPSKSNKLTPADVDTHLTLCAGANLPDGNEYDDTPLPSAQQALNYRLVRGTQLCVPVTVMTDVDWNAMDEAHARLKSSTGDAAPTAFTQFLWCVVRAMERYPKLRSSLMENGSVLRTFNYVDLGIAVALPDDLLAIAVIRAADRLSWPEFALAARSQIDLARHDLDQATASTTLNVSNIGSAGMRVGIGAVVSPAVATLTLGRTFMQPVITSDGYEFKKMATLTLTFDHRVLNGMGAAAFLEEVKMLVESFEIPQLLQS